MRKFLILLILFLPILPAAKETKKIVRDRISPEMSEIYYVLKSDTTVKHGRYQAGTLGKILIEGFFKMGSKDSLWTQYNIYGKIKSRGWYERNRRDSIWDFFNDKGELDQKIDFTNNSIVQYRTPFANHIFKIQSGDSCILSKLDRPPLYVGGAARFNDFFQDEITMPLHKPGDKVLGTVHVAFTIDTMGVTSNHHVLKGISRICNEEALRVIKSIPDDWMPGVLDGRHVTVEYIVAVVFDTHIRTMEF